MLDLQLIVKKILFKKILVIQYTNLVNQIGIFATETMIVMCATMLVLIYLFGRSVCWMVMMRLGICVAGFVTLWVWDGAGLLGHVEFDLYIRNKKRPDKNALDHDMEQGCLLTNMITDFAVRLRKKIGLLGL
jgi:hypothetical protein